MEFNVSCAYTREGERVLYDYPQLKKYNYRIEDNEFYLKINSLEELLQIRDELGQSLIIDTDGRLVIYDGYIE